MKCDVVAKGWYVCLDCERTSSCNAMGRISQSSTRLEFEVVIARQFLPDALRRKSGMATPGRANKERRTRLILSVSWLRPALPGSECALAEGNDDVEFI